VTGVDDRHIVPLTLGAQIGISLALAALLWWTHGRLVAVSILLGGIAAVGPNAFLGARLLGARAAETPASLMRSAWIGEIGKLLLTIGLFAAIFAFVQPISAPAVFGGYIAAQLAIFGALLASGESIGKEATKS
jgi:ATP synthase protein I